MQKLVPLNCDKCLVKKTNINIHKVTAGLHRFLLRRPFQKQPFYPQPVTRLLLLSSAFTFVSTGTICQIRREVRRLCEALSFVPTLGVDSNTKDCRDIKIRTLYENQSYCLSDVHSPVTMTCM